MNGGGGPLRVCTVATRAELAHARVLARSVRAADPQAKVSVLLLDDVDGAGTEDEAFELRRAAELGIEGFEHLAALCAPPALRRIAQAWLLRDLHAAAAGPLLYLDPSVRVYGSLDELRSLLARCELILNPTVTAPIPEDGKRPDREEIASWGAYDPGLVGVGAGQAGSFLEWWAREAAWEGPPDPAEALASEHSRWWVEEEERTHAEDLKPAPVYGSGRWLDLAAGLVRELHILREPGWNAGYWNLVGRRVGLRGGGWEIDGTPLRTFNFRGFDPTAPMLLSRHQDRISLADEPDLARLCSSYVADLEEQGIAEASTHHYGFDRLPDGTRFGSRLRLLYRDWVESGALAPPVFSERGRRAFFDWLREPALPEASPEANRYLFAIYLERPDLQRGIPMGLPDFGERLAEWARTAGRNETEIPPELMPGDAAEGAPAPSPVAPPPGARLRSRRPFDAWGVNVIGHHRFDFGIARAGRLAIEALDARSVPLLPIHDLALGKFKAEGPPIATLGLDEARFPINMLCLNGDHLLDLERRIGRSLFEDRYNAALWFWEVDRLPDAWFPAFELIDEVWAPSGYVAEVVSRSAPVPVIQVRLPLTVREAPALDRAAFGVGPDDFLFLYVFDFDSIGSRKNPLGLIEAFAEGFSPGSGATLLLKSSFSRNAGAEFEGVRRAAAEHPDIRVVDRRVDEAERDALIAGCDCYVSLHRSEGFGLTPAEAMLYSRPVIATAHGGNTDFMSPQNSYLVDFGLIPVGEGLDPYPSEARWAEPDIAEAARLMRHVFENRDEAAQRGRRGAEEVSRAYSPEAAGRIMEQRLAEIRDRFLKRREPGGGRARSLAARAMRRLGRPVPAALLDGTGGAAPQASAALLAQARAQERRLGDLERPRRRPSAERSS